MVARESRAVDVVRVRNALIAHNFVASQNVAVFEDNAFSDWNDSLAWIGKSDGSRGKRGSLRGALRRSTSAHKDPVNPALRSVLQALMDLLRPTELCRLLVTLQTVSALRRRSKGMLQAASSMPDLLGDGDGEFFLAIISNRLSGVQEDSIFILRAEPRTPAAPKKRISLRKAQSLQVFSLGSGSGSSKRNSVGRDGSRRRSQRAAAAPPKGSSHTSLQRETGSFVADSLANAPTPPVRLRVVKILPIWSDLSVQLKGRGLVRLTSSGESLSVGTASVRSMWRMVSSIQRAVAKAKENNRFPQGPSHAWADAYRENLALPEGPPTEPAGSDEDTGSDSGSSVHTADTGETNTDKARRRISEGSLSEARKVMTDEIRTIIQDTQNLDELTTRDVINKLNARLGPELVSSFKKAFIDETIMKIYGQQDPPSLIVDGMYLGTEYNASNYAELQALGIDEVINVTSEIKDFFPDLVDYYRIAVKDHEKVDLLSHLSAVCEYMAKARREGRTILVHCQRGISRSATVVIAYFMQVEAMPFEEAYALVRERRSVIKPNRGFLRQLEKFDAQLADTRGAN